jgi:hypothetical protein
MATEKQFVGLISTVPTGSQITARRKEETKAAFKATIINPNTCFN